MAATKRRLPVLKSDAAAADEVEARRPWQWVAFGTVMIFIAWLPLAYVGTTLVARAADGAGGLHPAAPLVAMLVPLVVASAAGGFLVGRFGRPAGVREALLSGLSTGLVAIALTALSGPFSPLFLLVAAIAMACAGGGGWLGVRGRPR
jgi:tRNA-(ms[2]io[6]A)-hydroxylase